MKLSAFIMLAFCLHLSARTTGQTVTLSVKDIPMKEVFRSIQEQTGYNILVNESVLEKTKNVSLDVKNMTVENVLNICFKNETLFYSIINGTIIVKQKDSNKEVQSGDTPPTVDIHGHVTDSLGNPLGGASVTVKGTKKGTSTDIHGDFVLHGLNGNEILIISFTGYSSKSITLNGNNSLSVSLEHSNNPLDQVQIIAYGTTTRRLTTGDVSVVSSEEIAQQPVSNPLEALEGRAPGLYIMQTSGFSGGGFSVNIRGLNSISNGNNPLYIIDGIPYPSVPIASTDASSGIFNGGNPLNSLNPSDIESISILKDADATSIYGSRGANGVILITMKKGRAGDTRVNAALYFGGGQITRKMDLLNTEQYLQMRREAFINDKETPDASSAPDLITWDTTHYTDWQKTLIGGTSHITDAQVSLSGGSESTQFLFGMGLHQETSVFPGDVRSRRISSNLNLTHTSKDKKLKFSLFGNYSSFNNNQYGTDPTTDALTTPPDSPPIYDSAGKINWDGGQFRNPFGSLERRYLGNTGNLLSHAEISYQLSSHFQILVNGGYNDINEQELLTIPKSSITPRFHIASGHSIFSNSGLQTWIIEPQIQYKSLIGNGNLQILIGSTFEQDISHAQSIYATGYSSDVLLSDMQAASSVTPSTNNQAVYKYEALFGRITYNWQDRYLFNVTGRRDGSSRFGPGKQFANFGSAGVGWIFSKTAWMQDHLPALNFGKLRASYGTTGNDQIGDYQYLDSYSPTSYPYLGVSGLLSTRLYNPDYSWETNKKFEAGLELNFWNNRISSAFNWYQNRSSNQLVGYPVPLITGQSSVQSNLPAIVQNTGWEFTFSVIAVKAQSFQWSSSINLSIPKNKLISFPNLASSPYANTYEVGKSLYIRKSYHYTGVDPTTGIYTFEDVNHDGMISYPEDLTAYKEVAQNYYGGFLNSFEYRGFRLELLFQFVKQTGPNYLFSVFNAPGMMTNQPDYVLGRWKKPGDQKPIQQYTQDYGSDANTAYLNTQSLGDNAFGDASFIRLKNISLTYSFKPSVLQKFHANLLSLFIQGQNLITITHYQGLDPENENISILPPLRILSIGFRCSF